MTLVNNRLKGGLLAMMLVCLLGPVSAGEPAGSWDKVVFHLDEVQSTRWALMLARSYLNDVPNARIVFVAYGTGVDFLVEDAMDDNEDPYEPPEIEYEGTTGIVDPDPDGEFPEVEWCEEC